MTDMTFIEYIESKHEVHMTEFRNKIFNEFYNILIDKKGESICSDEIADKIGYIDGKKINRSHIGETVRIARKCDMIPSLCSGHSGYWLDSSKEGMVGALRYIVTKIATLKRTAENMRDTINRVHGAGSVPEDVELWLYLEKLEEWCNDNDIDFDDYVENHGINR